MSLVQIEVFFPVPEGWGMCNSCEVMLAQADLGEVPQERGMDEYPPEWQEEYKRLSSTIYSLADRHKDKVLIRIWDPRSLQGMWKSIRHGVRRYPTFIVNGHDKVTGWEPDQLEQLVRAAVEINHSEL